MKLSLVIALPLLALLLTATNPAQAALLTVTAEREVRWNVLALTDEADGERTLEIKELASVGQAVANSLVSLYNEHGSVTLKYGSEDNQKEVDLTGYKEEIVRLEEVEAPRTLSIITKGSGFALVQRGVTAETEFPIKVNPEKSRLSVETPTGEKFLSVMPFDVVEQLTRANLITTVSNSSLIKLVEGAEGEVIYQLSGVKNIILLNIFTFDVPIDISVSALSGRVLKLDQPIWYSLFSFMLA